MLNLVPLLMNWGDNLLQLENFSLNIKIEFCLEKTSIIKKNTTLEEPWKFKLFDDDCGDLEKYIPIVIPHIEGHSFWYSGMIMHQMILVDGFQKVDYRITFQGHGLKCDGKWRLWW